MNAMGLADLSWRPSGVPVYSLLIAGSRLPRWGYRLETKIALVTFVSALVAALVSTPVVIRLAWRVLVVDRPDARKQHPHAIPRLGGVAILFAFITGVASALWYTGYDRSLLTATHFYWTGWIAAVLLLFGAGVVDDVKNLGPGTKLLIQIVAGGIVVACGFRIDHVVLPGAGLVRLGALALPATLLWLVAVTNAINLIDGLDGLAAGIGFLITATVAAISYYHGVFPVTVIAIALAGSLLGFLPYNFSPARIFLGDSGSQVLGFTLAVISIRGAQKSATLIAILAPILALGLPILDTVLVVTRRALRIQTETRARGFRARVRVAHGLFQADREHIHHNLLELGLSHRKSVITLYIAAAVFCAAAFALITLHDSTLAILLAVCLVLATVGVKVLAVRRRRYEPPAILAQVTLDAADPSVVASPTLQAGAQSPPGKVAGGGGPC